MPILPDGSGSQFIVQQDRTIDPLTVQRYCTGCPFKAVKTNVRNPSANGSTNPTLWEDSGSEQAPMLKTQYYCTSPNFDYKKAIFYNVASTIGFGYCPFFLEKWQQLESNHDPVDPPNQY
jgi:hypothetical protein